MSLASIKALRDHVKTDPILIAWCTANYGKELRHFIGYKKPVNANDYPALCYVPIRAKRGEQPYESETISLIIGVSEKELTDDVFDGVIRSDEAAQIITDRLLSIGGPISIQGGVITVTNDLGINHPLYESELQFTMTVSASLIGGSTLGDFVTLHADYDVDPFQPQTEHIKWAAEPPDLATSRPELTDTITLP